MDASKMMCCLLKLIWVFVFKVTLKKKIYIYYCSTVVKFVTINNQTKQLLCPPFVSMYMMSTTHEPTLCWISG